MLLPARSLVPTLLTTSSHEAISEDCTGLILVAGSDGVGLIDGNQHDHSSNFNHAPDLEGADSLCSDQLPTSVDTSADGMNTTSYSTGHCVAQLDFYQTPDMNHTPNTVTNGPPDSTEQGVTNQYLNIDQGSGYTTPEISSYRAPEVIPDEPEPSSSLPGLQQGGGGIQRPSRKLLPAGTPPRQSSSGDIFPCQICSKGYADTQGRNKHARNEHGASKKKAGRPSNSSRSVA